MQNQTLKEKFDEAFRAHLPNPRWKRWEGCEVDYFELYKHYVEFPHDNAAAFGRAYLNRLGCYKIAHREGIPLKNAKEVFENFTFDLSSDDTSNENEIDQGILFEPDEQILQAVTKIANRIASSCENENAAKLIAQGMFCDDDSDTKPFKKVVLYGDSGAGKSTLLNSLLRVSEISQTEYAQRFKSNEEDSVVIQTSTTMQEPLLEPFILDSPLLDVTGSTTSHSTRIKFGPQYSATIQYMTKDKALDLIIGTSSDRSLQDLALNEGELSTSEQNEFDYRKMLLGCFRGNFEDYADNEEISFPRTKTELSSQMGKHLSGFLVNDKEEQKIVVLGKDSGNKVLDRIHIRNQMKLIFDKKNTKNNVFIDQVEICVPSILLERSNLMLIDTPGSGDKSPLKYKQMIQVCEEADAVIFCKARSLDVGTNVNEFMELFGMKLLGKPFPMFLYLRSEKESNTTFQATEEQWSKELSGEYAKTTKETKNLIFKTAKQFSKKNHIEDWEKNLESNFHFPGRMYLQSALDGLLNLNRFSEKNGFSQLISFLEEIQKSQQSDFFKSVQELFNIFKCHVQAPEYLLRKAQEMMKEKANMGHSKDVRNKINAEVDQLGFHTPKVFEVEIQTMADKLSKKYSKTIKAIVTTTKDREKEDILDDIFTNDDGTDRKEKIYSLIMKPAFENEKELRDLHCDLITLVDNKIIPKFKEIMLSCFSQEDSVSTRQTPTSKSSFVDHYIERTNLKFFDISSMKALKDFKTSFLAHLKREVVDSCLKKGYQTKEKLLQRFQEKLDEKNLSKIVSIAIMSAFAESLKLLHQKAKDVSCKSHSIFVQVRLVLSGILVSSSEKQAGFDIDKEYSHFEQLQREYSNLLKKFSLKEELIWNILRQKVMFDSESFEHSENISKLTQSLGTFSQSIIVENRTFQVLLKTNENDPFKSLFHAFNILDPSLFDSVQRQSNPISLVQFLALKLGICIEIITPDRKSWYARPRYSDDDFSLKIGFAPENQQFYSLVELSRPKHKIEEPTTPFQFSPNLKKMKLF